MADDNQAAHVTRPACAWIRIDLGFTAASGAAALLAKHGWVSLRFWQHEDTSVVCDQIVVLVRELKDQQ